MGGVHYVAMYVARQLHKAGVPVDLGLDNLPVESLLLIYADFRTKSTRCNGKEIIHFYSLKEAFDVILSKLDNVNEDKRQRYIRVYRKLRDFEDYMTEHGVVTAIEDQEAAFIRASFLYVQNMIALMIYVFHFNKL